MKKTFLFLLAFGFITSTFAEDAKTLPKGRFRARLKPIFAFDMTEKYDDEQNKVSLVKKFEKQLDKATMAKLNTTLAGIMGGISSLGTFDPSLDVETLAIGSAIEYGVTDNLTLGLIVPVVAAKSKFDLNFYKTAAAQAHPFFKTMDFPKAIEQVAVTKGYYPIEDWDRTGMGDVELGFKYRFLNTLNWGMAAKSGVRCPTGRVDDPDHLTDIGFGDGQTDLGTTLLVDFYGVKNLLVNFMTKYTAQLPDQQTLRVPDADEIFTTKKELIHRDLGDRLDAAFSLDYGLLKGINLSSALNYTSKGSDNYKSANGFNTAGLELDTYQMNVTTDVGLGFSTLPWFREGAFGIPMDLGLNLQLPLIGQNVPKATVANLEYKLYF